MALVPDLLRAAGAPQAADALRVSTSTAKADWTYAKSWLRAELIQKS